VSGSVTTNISNYPHLQPAGWLRVALESCFEQSYENFAIIVGDDLSLDDFERVVEEFQRRASGKIRYQKNRPSLGQAENVNSLFKLAAGVRLVLRHDEDFLLPRTLQELSDCWKHTLSLSAAFGKQYVADMSGKALARETDDLNRLYGRTAANAGLVMPGLAGIIRMFPNDGYMVLTERARSIGLRPFSRVGDACDFDFGVRYCADNGAIWFHDAYTCVYRLSVDAISKTALTAPFVYRTLSEYRTETAGRLTPVVGLALRQELENAAPRAVSDHARAGQGLQALRILILSDYVWRERLRLRL